MRRPATPRFNMPFELGLAVAWDKLNAGRHVWFVLEAKSRRVHNSLSDLGGTDAYIHGGKPQGVFRELGNALVRTEHQPTVQQMNASTSVLSKYYLKLEDEQGPNPRSKRACSPI